MKTIFVSYAHEDIEWCRRVVDELKILETSHELSILVFWDETIEPGADWEKRILDAIDRCAVAVLLVSKSFLDSEFIKTKELPHLIRLGVALLEQAIYG
jgi:hypothetical protein